MNIWYEAHATLFQTTAIYVLLALSFQVVLKSGIFSFFSVGAFGIGAYTAANLATRGVPLIVTLLIVVVTMAAVGYLLAIPLMHLRGLYLGMVTFAIDEILVVVATNGGKITGGAVGLFGVPLEITTLGLGLVAVIGVLLVSQLERHNVGRAIEVLRGDEQLARSVGVEVGNYRKLIFALSAALGGIAGALNTMNFSTVTPGSFGFTLIVAGLTMAIVGGIGSWRGAVLGAIFVAWFPAVSTALGGYRSIVYGVLVILVVAYEPDGLLGIIRWVIRGGQGQLARRRSAVPAPAGAAPATPPGQSPAAPAGGSLASASELGRSGHDATS